VADAVPSGTVAMVGPVSPRLTPASRAKLRSRPNVCLLGSRDRRSLPGYLMGFDCCLLPYRSGPWGEHGSPLKLWDYLYAGAPLVASGYAILRDLPDFVTYVTAPEAFARAVSAALAAGPRGEDAVRRRRAYALANTWDHRAAQLLRLAERVRGVGR
jgi:hypothetical protein